MLQVEQEAFPFLLSALISATVAHPFTTKNYTHILTWKSILIITILL